MPGGETDRSEGTATEGKKWFRVSKTSEIFKVADAVIKPGSGGVRIKSEAILPQPPVRKIWEVHLYKLVGATRYKVMVEYDEQKYCELKLRNKKKVYELVGVKMGVDYPEEFAGSGGGFDGAGLGGFGGTKDGIMKSLSAFSSSNAVKLGKVKYKAKPKVKAPKKLASGHNLYSAMGTQEIKTREYDPSAKRVMHDSKDEKDYVTAELRGKLQATFDLLAETIGEDAGTPHAKIPQDKTLDVFDHAKYQLTEIQRKRIGEFSRFDTDEFIEFEQLLGIYNRVENEQAQGHFHMTVRELQDLFNQADKDFSGMLEHEEIAKILTTVHLVTDAAEIKNYLSTIDKDDDHQLDFEEFMTLTQKMYAERGGFVVANKSGPMQFNQTRNIIDDLRDSVERHHLMITHLHAQIANFDEQLEIMNTIEAHSSLRAELNKTKEEKKRLAKLRDEMEMQNKGWMRDIKGIHAREKRDAMEKIEFINQQKGEAQQALAFVKDAYEDDYGDALKEVAEVMQSLNAVLDFSSTTVESTGQDYANAQEMTRLAKERLARYTEGRKGTVFNPAVYDSATAIHLFLQNKTSALEQWLISRTQFTQADREKYLKRVEEVKKVRETFEVNMVELVKQQDVVTKKTKKLDKQAHEAKKVNVDLRKKLNDPTNRVHDEAKAKELMAKLEATQEEISNGHMLKLEWSRKLYPLEHKLHMERHAISLLQVELGELKVLLEDVKHHEDVQIFEDNKVKKNKAADGSGGNGGSLPPPPY